MEQNVDIFKVLNQDFLRTRQTLVAMRPETFREIVKRTVAGYGNPSMEIHFFETSTGDKLECEIRLDERKSFGAAVRIEPDFLNADFWRLELNETAYLCEVGQFVAQLRYSSFLGDLTGAQAAVLTQKALIVVATMILAQIGGILCVRKFLPTKEQQEQYVTINQIQKGDSK